MLLTLLALSGCFKVDYTTQRAVEGEPDSEVWNHRVIWGIIELDGPLQVQDICSDGDFARIHVETDMVSGLISYLVNGSVVGGFLYSPNIIQVWCADGLAYRAAVSQDGAVLALEAPVGQSLPPELGVSDQSCATW